MSLWIWIVLAITASTVLLQGNTFIVHFLRSKGNPLTTFPLNLMLKIHRWFGEFDAWLGRVFRAYGKLVDDYGWDIADRTFKVLGWILIAGTVRAIAHISDNWLLRSLAYVIFGILGLALAKPVSKVALVIRDRGLSRFKISFPLGVLIGFLIWFTLITTLWAAISLLIVDITNFLPPASDGTENPVN